MEVDGKELIPSRLDWRKIIVDGMPLMGDKDERGEKDNKSLQLTPWICDGSKSSV